MPSSGYTAWSVIAGEQPTAAKWNQLGSNDASFNNGNGFEDSIILSRHLGAGMVAQEVIAPYTDFATGTTLIPYDDTIPQNTEGTQFMTCSITPKSATNTLIVEAKAYLTSNTGSRHLTGAIFRDSAANAVGADVEWTGGASEAHKLVVGAGNIVAGSTAPTTFKFHAGADGAATITFNGLAGARRYGAIAKSWIKITEVRV